MKELFFHIPSVLGLCALAVIIVWFVFTLLKKNGKVRICTFLLSHFLLYLDLFLLRGVSFCTVGGVITFLTLLGFILTGRKKNGDPYFWIYCLFSVFLFLFILSIILLYRMDISFLALHH